ncbi:MAG: hypothetical protein WKF85_12125 [Chitinophagaceae bacterium]
MEDNILQRPLQQLNLSESFKEMAYNHSFKTLEDILNWPVNVLLQHNGFTYHHFHELIKFLKEKKSLHLLKTKAS